MFSFIISIAALILGFFLYGRFVERVFGPDPARQTPALAKADGVDYVPMPAWKVYMIQFLNIAGTGPIFGAIMGAKFGPASYLWIVLGCIFGGAVHDYFTGMLSMRHDGASLPELVKRYLGKGTSAVMLVFCVVMMTLVGAVFVYSPALILGDIAPLAGKGTASILIWCGVVFVYYIIATMLPIDKIIGRFYPIFAFALLFMAVALCVCLLVKWPAIPEIWGGLGNMGEASGLLKGQPIFPCLFITIACGAISGFHATQSPIMARCMKSEKLGRPIFYGAMITEGIVALIWAAVASYFFYGGGADEVGSTLTAAAPTVVTKVSKGWLGVFGGVLALLGVVAAPITSGDTAFRSARLILADFLKLPQKKHIHRLVLALPLFAIAALLLWYNIADENGFNTIWRYFGWANQTLACFSLWTVTAWLTGSRKGAYYLVTMIPAAFMTAVCTTYICVDKIGFHLPFSWIPWIAVSVFALSVALYYILTRRTRRQ
ncbi:MAG: carbon starvation protein A [Bacteroidales bacterium]|nr:carbon starvation protein A [Bacteroidales bacterium]